MSALLARDTTGRGQHVEVSLLQGVMSLTTQNWNWTEKGGQFLLPKGYPSIHQNSIYECANGQWIHAATISGIPSTRSEASILGIEDIPPRTVFALPAAERAEYESKRRAAYLSRDRDGLVKEFRAAGLGAEPIVAPHERFSHPHLQAANSIVEVVDPEVGATTQVGVSIFLDRTPGAVKGPQPLAGTHTDEILSALGCSDDELATLRTRGVI
jgi:crotonobetainyl-CoA:carnitine CoA-transferase CaiB-like acyl-CoA transferase